MSASGFEYKPHVDGLRAVAVLLVVLFHVGVPGIHGGFIGVDVFFVISGYLITSLLLIEAQAKGSVDLLGFYARRVRRLFPALLVVVLATLVLGALFLLPIFQEQSALAKSAVATAFYLSNFYFWKFTGDYFDGPSDFEPLLHTWSLAVEEQFYFVWPLLVIALLKFAHARGDLLRVRLLYWLVALSLVSFAINLWATSAEPSAAFYLMPGRAWQFGAGGILALWLAAPRKVSPVVAGALSIGGLVAVLAGGLLLTEVGFPGVAALLPTLGAAAIIGGNTLHAGGPVARLLAWQPLRLIGLVSYSWYLWHWPLLAIARASSLERYDLLRDALLGLLALGLAALTYVLIEKPVRLKRPGPFRATPGTLFTGVAISVVMVGAAVALAGWAKYAASSNPRYMVSNAARYDVSARRATCNHPMLSQFRGLPPAGECTTGNAGEVGAVLWGDSHADHLASLLEAYGEEQKRRGVLQRTMSSCRTYGKDPIKISESMVRACEDFNAAVEREIMELKAKGLTGVIVSTMWISTFRDPETIPTSFVVDTSPEYYASAEATLNKVIDRLDAAGLRVLIFGPFHMMPQEIPQCLARHDDAVCSAERSFIERQRKPSLEVLQRLIARHDPSRVRLWDPLDSVCGKETCSPTRDGKVLYTDALHLTASGARTLLPDARAQLDWVTGAE